MQNLISDAVAFGLRLKRCSCGALSKRGEELVALGHRLQDAWNVADTDGILALRARLCHLARQTAVELEQSMDVTFFSVSTVPVAGWALIFGTAPNQPVPLRPEQFVWMAEAACAA